MDKSIIEEKIKEILKDKLGVDDNEIKDDSSIVNDLGADSLDAVEIIMEVEKEFSIAISDEQAESLKTVQQIVDHVASQIK